MDGGPGKREEEKQGRIHGYLSRVRVGRGSNESLQALKQRNPRSKIDVPTDRLMCFSLPFQNFYFFKFFKRYLLGQKGRNAIVKSRKNVALTKSNWPCKQLVMQV